LNTFYLVSNFDLSGIGSVAAAQANGPEARCRELENVTVPGLRIDAVKWAGGALCGRRYPQREQLRVQGVEQRAQTFALPAAVG
jgi:hypothetical protein